VGGGVDRGFDTVRLGGGPIQPPAVGTVVAELGRQLVGDWVVPLEVLAVLLTAALIGAVVIALEDKEKGGGR
jgi:NADH:ubiquinone oxidoreductase subunit 6 (subunit J)